MPWMSGSGGRSVFSSMSNSTSDRSRWILVDGTCITLFKHYWLVVWNINSIFPYIGNNHPNWLIFFRGVQTTNQITTKSRWFTTRLVAGIVVDISKQLTVVTNQTWPTNTTGQAWHCREFYTCFLYLMGTPINQPATDGKVLNAAWCG